MLLGEGVDEPPAAAVRVAVQAGRAELERLERRGEGAELALVGGELDHPLEAQLALNLLDGLARLVRDEPCERGPGQVTGHAETLTCRPMDEIGLFPLNLVLVPGEQAPLHIFEPRYRELIGECLDYGNEFGLVLEDDEGMRDIGVRCAVVEVIDRFPDGRLNVVVEAHDRFQLVGLTEGRSFRTGEVEVVPDESDTPNEDEIEECLAAYARVVAAAEAELDDLDLDADSIAYQIASRVDFGPEIKQGLLELRSERDRVLRLAPMLNQAAEAVEREREIRHRAGGNGRVEPL